MHTFSYDSFNFSKEIIEEEVHGRGVNIGEVRDTAEQGDHAPDVGTALPWGLWVCQGPFFLHAKSGCTLQQAATQPTCK